MKITPGVMIALVWCIVEGRSLLSQPYYVEQASLKGPVRFVEAIDSMPSFTGEWDKRLVRVRLEYRREFNRRGYLIHTQGMTSAVWQSHIYDDKGRLRERVRSGVGFTRPSEERLKVSRTIYSYDSLGQLIRTDESHLPGDSLSTVTYTYTPAGLPAVITYYGDSGRSVIARDISTYTPSGGRQRHITEFSDDSARVCFSCTYDPDGYLLEYRQYCDAWSLEPWPRDMHMQFINDSLGNPVIAVRSYSDGEIDTLTYSYRYDRYGNWTERRTTGRESYTLHGRTTKWSGLKSIMKRRIEYFDQNTDDN